MGRTKERLATFYPPKKKVISYRIKQILIHRHEQCRGQIAYLWGTFPRIARSSKWRPFSPGWGPLSSSKLFTTRKAGCRRGTDSVNTSRSTRRKVQLKTLMAQTLEGNKFES